MWSLDGGTLSFVRTFRSGAYRVLFALTRERHGGMKCRVTEAFAREEGRGPIQLMSPVGGRNMTIVNAKQVSATCKITSG